MIADLAYLPSPLSSPLPSSLSSTVYDVVIVGAGLAGSSLASVLADQGWRVLLAERDRFPRHKVCGEFLSPEARNTLQAQGLHPGIAALEPVPLHGAELTAHTGRKISINLPGEAWGLSRYALDAALATAAEQRGAELWTGTTVTSWQETARGMVVHLRRRQERASSVPDHGEITRVQARALVMACGRHISSGLLPNRQTHGVNRPAPPSMVGVKCHFANLSMPAQVELYLFDGGYIGMNRVENGDVNVCGLASYATFARAGRSPSAMIKAAAQWNPAFGRRMLDAQALPHTECSVAPVETRRKAQPWDNLPLLGDTVTMIPPLCGDGMAMALRSAEMCAPLLDSFLRSRFTWQELGRRYSRLWHSEFDSRLRMGRLLETMLQSPQTTELLFRAGARIPALANYFVRATRGASQ